MMKFNEFKWQAIFFIESRFFYSFCKGKNGLAEGLFNLKGFLKLHYLRVIEENYLSFKLFPYKWHKGIFLVQMKYYCNGVQRNWPTVHLKTCYVNGFINKDCNIPDHCNTIWMTDRIKNSLRAGEGACVWPWDAISL